MIEIIPVLVDFLPLSLEFLDHNLRFSTTMFAIVSIFFY
jgi:hypothetical protein